MSTTPVQHHARHWLPESRSGWWALSLAAVALGGAVALAVGFAAGLEPADSFTDSWFLTSAGVVVLASAVGSVVTGLSGLIRDHDRSLLVMTGTGASVLVAAVMIQQVAEGAGWLSG